MEWEKRENYCRQVKMKSSPVVLQAESGSVELCKYVYMLKELRSARIWRYMGTGSCKEWSKTQKIEYLYTYVLLQFMPQNLFLSTGYLASYAAGARSNTFRYSLVCLLCFPVLNKIRLVNKCI
jgi:hypothetical protein